MIQNIRNAFIELLDEVSWMDDMTRELARKKVNDVISYKSSAARLLNYINYDNYIIA